MIIRIGQSGANRIRICELPIPLSRRGSDESSAGDEYLHNDAEYSQWNFDYWGRIGERPIR